ncbi:MULTISPECIES: MarR family winged helix-turn-helix transcriptional regulator [Loigolactobacillus]|uniref:MarR family transcriptional regulator n=1 Tax=Loigolactobacillus backii TaxID=375175 RepID=A0A192H0Q4_9LACO|nr:MULTISPECIES: MarR family transcriptional regulator [Loigolactobacillus]ANK61935.1 MarR family transcriptional regulator [Loigolactobacillus backii]ANK68871.1 MarR family transcriptional regulator [Loigolactobacillus backii]MDA5386870.1 MarR family transcriptional regulator [Loigolactobacillus backii]MDA5389346.1 MarR family transcriptional regulator [Loigolactobacillus backii]PIO82451.1 MarR family transcriptional regulator [Loigolactobacillus backii]
MAKENNDLLEKYINVYLTSFKYVGDLVSEPTKRYHLSFEQFLIMRDIDNGQQMGMSEIAAKRGVTRAAISRQIRVMLEQNYIVQERDINDRRRLYLLLTTKGQEVTERINQAIHKRFYAWVDLLGEDEANDLLRIMQDVSKKIISRDKATKE